MMIPAIRVENLSKLYKIGHLKQRSDTLRDQLAASLRGLGRRKLAREDEIWALKDVSFDVQPGEVVGVIGRNGAGKSTLLKILARITEPTSGRAVINGRVGSLLEVGTGFHPELTGRENIYLNGAILGMRRTEIEKKFDEIVAFSEIEKFLDTPVKRYSSGMYVRLAFAVAAHLEPEILLVDEVLAVGDAAFQKKCLGKMGEVACEGRTVLFVSHNMAAVTRLCTNAIYIESGSIQFYGQVSDAVIGYENAQRMKISKDAEAYGRGCIYQKLKEDHLKFQIVKVETLDGNNEPKDKIYTWDLLKVRIHYYAEHYVASASIVIHLANRYGDTILMLSTSPDANILMRFEPGIHYIDCLIQQLPLAAGDYVMGCGMAIPNTEWLFKDYNLAKFSVLPKDVYLSGFAPHYPRTLIAVPHQWIL